MAKSVSKRSNTPTRHNTQFVAEARQIKELEQNAEKHVRHALDDCVKIGRLLLRVKKGLEYGEWLPWLEKNYAGSVDRAERFMRLEKLAKKYPDRFRKLRNLSPSTLLLLASKGVDVQTIDDVIARIESGERVIARQIARPAAANLVSVEVGHTPVRVVAPAYVKSAPEPVRTIVPVYRAEPESVPEPEDLALVRCVDLIETMCAVDSWPAALEVANAIRRRRKDVTPSSARSAARFLQALSDELDDAGKHGLPRLAHPGNRSVIDVDQSDDEPENDRGSMKH